MTMIETKEATKTASAEPPQVAASKGEVAEARRPTNFEIELANYEPQIAAVLPSHISIVRFKRTILTAVNTNPDLLRADRRSFFNACVRCAQDGLFPDGREAALVIFNTRVKARNQHGAWEGRHVEMVQYMPMIAGVYKRMRNSGEVVYADAQAIYEHDHFDYELGDSAHITHKPMLGDRGQIIGAYAIAKLASGEIYREVMSRSEIEISRSQSRAPNSLMWTKFYAEGARKTVMRRLSKRLPVSAELAEFLTRTDQIEGEATDIGNQASLPAPRPTRAEFRDGTDAAMTPQGASAGESISSPDRDMDREYRQAMGEVITEETVDGETGEVTQASEQTAATTHPDWTPWLRDACDQLGAASAADLPRVKVELDDAAAKNGAPQAVFDQLSAAFHRRRSALRK